MAITDYTTYDEVRAVLGVAPEEIEDETLALPLYGILLDEGILGMSELLPSSYAVVLAIDPKSANQTRFINLMSAWAAYQVAAQLLAALPMFGPKTIESDKDKQERVIDPYADLRAQVPAMLNTLAARVLALLAILFPGIPVNAAVGVINVVNAGLAVDPITG